MTGSPLILEYKAIIGAVLQLLDCAFKPAHNSLSKSTKNGNFLHYLTKVFVEASVSEVLDAEKVFCEESQALTGLPQIEQNFSQLLLGFESDEEEKHPQLDFQFGST